MLNNLVELSVQQAAFETGQRVYGGLPAILGAGKQVFKPGKMPAWTEQEDDFLRTNLGRLTDIEIGAALGRTPIAVHLRSERDLHLPARSKSPEVITAQGVARLLGLDDHAVTYWCDVGLIPTTVMPGGRKIRLIRKSEFERWVLNPENWIYFHAERVTDERLRRLLAKRAARWGDEWWTTPRVAAYHNVAVGDVKRYIQNGWLRGRQIEVSKGGRNPDRYWANWFVLRSEATRPDLHFYRHSDRRSKAHFTMEGDAWIVRAREELGLTFRVIALTMKRKTEIVRYRYVYLKKRSNS